LIRESQRKAAEQALSISEQGYRSVIDDSSDAVLIFDHSGTVYVNSRAQTLSGFSEAEMSVGQLSVDSDYARKAVTVVASGFPGALWK
jgi:PAS domain-containing protein